MLALIGEGFWSVLIITPSENPDPVGTVACHLGHLPDALALREQPDDLSVASFDRISRFAVSLLQLIAAEVGSHLDISWQSFPSGRDALSEDFLSGSEPDVNSAVGLISLYPEMV